MGDALIRCSEEDGLREVKNAEAPRLGIFFGAVMGISRKKSRRREDPHENPVIPCGSSIFVESCAMLLLVVISATLLLVVLYGSE